ncbi:sensor domain-containing diguanylate cyclase [Diaphorobacter sp.]|uniref:sensor domain-containing diguanylate cyclase n=1 Tax=Diaphorobacter sp. TaxID=1934310 RepID=UPI003D128D6C
MTPAEHAAVPGMAAADRDAGEPGWFPGPLVRKLVAVAVLAVVMSGAMAVWLVSRTVGQEAMQRFVRQQNDEVELVARLLASKIEQSQKVLDSVAEGITPEVLDSPASLEWLLQQGLPAVRFFDAIQVARMDGTLSVNLRYGRLEKASDLDPAERDYLVRTLLEGKPLVSDLIGTTAQDARVMFTLPLLRGEGRVTGAVAGLLRLQSQGLLPHSLALPARSESRLMVFTQDGVILSHPDLQRVMGRVQDEPGLADAYARWRNAEQPAGSRGVTQVQPGHVVSLARVPMPQWVVARVSDSQAMLAPLHGAQRRSWWLAGAATALVAALAMVLMVWLARPLALLRQRALMSGSAAGPGALCAVDSAAESDAQFLADNPCPQLQPDPSTEPPWPRCPGEVDDTARVCAWLIQSRRLAQRSLRAAQQQLQRVLDHVPQGVAVTRGEHVELVSLQACRMLGYTQQQLQGRHMLDLLTARDGGADLARQVRSEFAAHGIFDGELPLRREDGSTLWVHARGHCVQPDEPARGMVWTLEDLTAVRETRQQLAWVRTRDALTQLMNRAEFEHRLEVLLLERARRPQLPGEALQHECGVLLFMDLDHFTVVNDVAGHDAGDDVLRRLARLLESEVGNSGWAARLGGDEFAVLLPGSTVSRGQAVAEQLRAAVQAWEPAYQGRSFTLGLSIGLVPLHLGSQDAAAVLYAADMACYQAKRTGRNRVALAQLPAQA